MIDFNASKYLSTQILSAPQRAGIGLKPEHFGEILDSLPDIGFFEVHAENYMVDGGPLHFYLERIREHYPLSIHGVGLSIGSLAPIDKQHLNRLKVLLERYQPDLFSEHLAWSSHAGVYLNDLLPLPYTPSTLKRVCDHIDQVQSELGRQMLIENPSTYVEFASSSMSETDFITAVIQQTGCGLLLDINNVFVSCTNHQHDPLEYIDSLPFESVGEIHLAGFATDTDSDGTAFLIDSHDEKVAPQVWDLYEKTLKLTGPRPTLLERDGNLPSWNTLYAEAMQAEQCMRLVAATPKVVQHA